MKICLVTAFPPSRERLNEYGYHIAEELANRQDVSLTVLADRFDGLVRELPGFDVVRCWKFNSVVSPWSLVKTVREINPDLVWFNLVFSSFGDSPIAAFLGICSVLLLRCSGFYTHITLHHIIETLDLSKGTRVPRLYQLGGAIATRILLSSHSLSVLLPSYRRVLINKYGGENIHLRNHGTFSAQPQFPDTSSRGNSHHRILAFGKWGTYKRLEGLIDAFLKLSANVRNVRLVIAGSDHPFTPGYLESIRERWKGHPDIEFHGYVPEQEVSNLFSSASVLVLPYSSAAGTSGVAHQACECALPIVASDLADFRDMSETEEIAVEFFRVGDSGHLAAVLESLLRDPARQARMAEQNFAAALRMTMPEVVSQYVLFFSRALALRKRRRRLRDRSLAASCQEMITASSTSNAPAPTRSELWIR